MVCMSVIKGEQIYAALLKHGESNLAAWLKNAMAPDLTEAPRLGPREAPSVGPEEHAG